MRRFFVAGISLLLVLGLVVFWILRTRGVEFEVFSHQIGNVLQAHQVTVTGREFEAAGDTPLPWLVKWNPLFWNEMSDESKGKVGLGTAMRCEVYWLKHSGADLECRLRRTSDIVQYVELRCHPKDQTPANEVAAAMAAAFPDLVVRVKVRAR